MEHPLGDVLSVTTGCLVSRDHLGGVYRVCDFMGGVPHMTHQLPRASIEVTPVILAQHPELADVVPPEVPEGATPDETQAAVFGWLEQQEARFGATIDLTPMADYQPRGPLTELAEMVGDKPIIAIAVGDDQRFTPPDMSDIAPAFTRLGETGNQAAEAMGDFAEAHATAEDQAPLP